MATCFLAENSSEEMEICKGKKNKMLMGDVEWLSFENFD